MQSRQKQMTPSGTLIAKKSEEINSDIEFAIHELQKNPSQTAYSGLQNHRREKSAQPLNIKKPKFYSRKRHDTAQNRNENTLQGKLDKIMKYHNQMQSVGSVKELPVSQHHLYGVDESLRQSATTFKTREDQNANSVRKMGLKGRVKFAMRPQSGVPLNSNKVVHKNQEKKLKFASSQYRLRKSISKDQMSSPMIEYGQKKYFSIESPSINQQMMQSKDTWDMPSALSSMPKRREVTI